MPKRQHFSYQGMVARSMLAALDNNNNIQRKQATNKKGEKRFNIVRPKGRKSWIGRKLYEGKSYTHVEKMLSEVVHRVEVPPPEHPVIKLSNNQPQNIAKIEKPDKSELVTQLKSRFKNT